MDYISLNLQLHFSQIPAQTKGMKVIHSDNLTFVDSGLPCDTFNVIHIRNAATLQEDELKKAIEHFRNQQSAFCIWISDEDCTDQVSDFFSKMDIQHQAEETGMILDLASYKFTSNSLHKQITIVDDLKKLTDYAKVIAENWSPPDQHVIQYYQLTADGYLNPENQVVLLVFYLDGQPVSSVELFPTDEETIGLYGFATLEAFRGQGIGSALMTYSLNLAKEKGYKRAILQASEDGIGIYKRMGFKVINTYFEYA